LKLKCDEPLSNFAFNFNLRRYSLVLNAVGYGDAALWKLSGEGTTLWVMRSNGTLNGVAVDSANAVVAAGSFSSSPAMFGGVALTHAGGGDAVLWKLSAEGTTLWAVRGGGTLQAVAVDSANAVVAAVKFSSSYPVRPGIIHVIWCE